MLQGVVVAPGAIKVSAATQDRAVSEVEPQIVRLITLLTLPSTRGDSLLVAELSKVLCIPGKK